jgi:cytochrome c
MPIEVPEGTVVPNGNDKKGAKLFKAKCAQCHSFEKGGSNKSGPALYNVMGRPAGKEDYGFSSAIKDSGIVWSGEHLWHFLINPKKYVTGTKMVFAGLKKEQERADLIAFLQTGGK